MASSSWHFKGQGHQALSAKACPEDEAQLNSQHPTLLPEEHAWIVLTL